MMETLQLIQQYGGTILRGLGVTLALTLSFVLVGGMLGLALAGLRLIPTPLGLLDRLIGLYVMYHRNVPMVVQMLFWYFGMPQLLPAAWTQAINASAGEFIFAAIALSAGYAAYVSEDLRSGLRALDRGQTEASMALGLGYLDRLRYVLLPQALRAASPAIASQTLLFFKATSLAAAIGVSELAHVAQEINNDTFRTFEVFALVTVTYMTISMLLLRICGIAERRFGRHVTA